LKRPRDRLGPSYPPKASPPAGPAGVAAGGLEDLAVAAGLRGEAPWPLGTEDPDFRAVSPFWGDICRICPPFWGTTALGGRIA